MVKGKRVMGVRRGLFCKRENGEMKWLLSKGGVDSDECNQRFGNFKGRQNQNLGNKLCS